MNDAGLAVTINEIHLAKDANGRQFNTKGTPLLLAFRRVLEECSTVSEAEKLMRSIDRTTCALMTACDKKGGSVFEMTTKNLEVRSADNRVCCATNHFRTDKLALENEMQDCWRFKRLEKFQKGEGKLGVDDVVKQLHAVNLDDWTIQTMVFEPATLTLHLAHGRGPASGLPLKKLELGPLFVKGHAAR
jgi:isopenicillin-N N-acyltransferase like protein